MKDKKVNASIQDYKNIVDTAYMVGIYVVTELDHEVLYMNHRAKEMIPEMCIGDKCDGSWKCFCDNCPLVSMGEKALARTVFFDEATGKTMEMAASRTVWNDIPAFVLRIWPRFEDTNDFISGGY